MDATTVDEQSSAQPEALPRGESAGEPATTPAPDTRDACPTASLAGLADALEGVTDRLTQHLAAAGPDPQEEAEHCF